VRSARLASLYALPAITVVVAWVRLEHPRAGVERALLLALLALAPALVRPLRARLVAAVVVIALGGWIAVGASPLHPLRLVTRLVDGTLEFYDVTLPYDPTSHPRMQGAALFAAFVICVALAIALARRRLVAAVLLVIAGAAWPGTLLRGSNQLLLGGLILAAVLLILAGLRPPSRRALVPASVAGAVVVGCALVLSLSPAVARGELLHWEGWDLYTKPDRPVSIAYVWDSQYGGLDWPKKRTTVLRVATTDRPFYWRATTLDSYIDENWIEQHRPLEPIRDSIRDDLSHDSLLPARARRSTDWIRQEVGVAALEDVHLVGAETPVAYGAADVGAVNYAEGGTAIVAPGADRGEHYTVWSYVARPGPAQLARSKPIYPAAARRYLSVDRETAVPRWGAPQRDASVRRLLRGSLYQYASLYAEAKRVVGNARNPYTAVVGLESWLRDSGRFRYDQHPPPTAGVPPLVAFVSYTRRGYCQHFAGAMALMLRYLGIPARVAAGFTSGRYRDGTWTVTDHDAHAWVEVWFRGYGWLPFDPTPGRGHLSAPYTAASSNFDATSAAALVGVGALRKLFESRVRAAGTPQALARGEHARSVPVPTDGRSHRLLIVALVLLALAAAGWALLAAKLARRRLRYATNDPRAVAFACRRELVEFLADQRVEVPASATAAEVARLVLQEYALAADGFVRAVEAARFGAPEAAAAAAAAARREVRELRRLLRGRLGAFDRVSGALSLRSLRV